VQYWLFISKAVQGDFGRSLKGQMPVMDLIKERLPNSIKLAAVSLTITVLFAFPLGVLAAVKKGTALDTVANLVAVLGQSLPQFWVGIVLIQIFAVGLRWLPVAGVGGVSHYILPAFTLGWFVVAGMMRLLRSSMLDVLDSEFIKMARIKGVPWGTVLWKHALRNALIPVLTFGAIYFAILITGAILVETVFAWPGIGQLVYQGIVFRDFPVIQAIVLLTAGIVVAVNLLVDITYAYVDPRIRYG
jgi:peptide/nickel transport system permease protein